jgi:hypothetical protein
MGLGAGADPARLVKVFARALEGDRPYSPAEAVAASVAPVIGQADPNKICTSHVERENLTMRMQIRRFTRPTNAFGKKWEHHCATLRLHSTYYNFAKIHSSIRVTLAMEAGLTDHVWTTKKMLTATSTS